MDLKTITLQGFTVTPFLQLYEYADSSKSNHGELLSRIDGDRTPGELIHKMSVQEHLTLIEWQIDIANKLEKFHGLTCSINIDNGVLIENQDLERFSELASQAPAGTTFEFTESHEMPDPEIANRMFEAIRDRGCTTALDDFGTGLNGMSLLTEYDFDIVKVDKTLIHDVDKRPEKLKVISLLNEMLMTLNRAHVVEGIERREIYDLLVEANFKVFQGYLFHMPVSLLDPDFFTKLQQPGLGINKEIGQTKG